MLVPVGVSLVDAALKVQGTEDVRCLWTWAILTNPLDRPLPLECSAKRLPDHRAAYLEYEGAISGDRGQVDQVASGSYEVIGWSEDRIELRVKCNDEAVAEHGGPFLVLLRRTSEGWSLSWSVFS